MDRNGYVPDGGVVQAPPTSGGDVLSAQKGVCATSTDGLCQKVFILWNDRFLGTDTREPSPAILAIAPAGPARLTVTYANYAEGDPACCPSLSPVTVVYTCNAARCVWSGPPPGHSPDG